VRASEYPVPGECNGCGRDRIARGVLGTGLLVVALGPFVTGRGSVGVIATAVAITLLYDAVTGFCGVNPLFGIDTCRGDTGENG